eukprot:TRINITY_DN27575_c0_g1_i1.p1 TRINITY_DN27575_c0_g1~~TRINITY_DN27575_c0_g1_i1.p1  ORF type:complete len:266 (+),score=37.06 TRINITY_DN27575_c0_g1_i1:117-914(+)
MSVPRTPGGASQYSASVAGLSRRSSYGASSQYGDACSTCGHCVMCPDCGVDRRFAATAGSGFSGMARSRSTPSVSVRSALNSRGNAHGDFGGAGNKLPKTLQSLGHSDILDLTAESRDEYARNDADMMTRSMTLSGQEGVPQPFKRPGRTHTVGFTLNYTGHQPQGWHYVPPSCRPENLHRDQVRRMPPVKEEKPRPWESLPTMSGYGGHRPKHWTPPEREEAKKSTLKLEKSAMEFRPWKATTNVAGYSGHRPRTWAPPPEGTA